MARSTLGSEWPWSADPPAIAVLALEATPMSEWRSAGTDRSAARDDELVRHAQDGHAQAFEVLVDRHAPAMYRLAAGMVGPDDARDAVQDAFVAAWRELPRLRKPELFEAWLRRIVVNRTRNLMRTRRRRPSISLDATVPPAYREPMSGDFREAVHARQALDGAFETLSADQRVVVTLHYGAGYTLSAVAEATDARLGTVKSRLNAALRQLRRAIPEDSR